MDLLNSDDQQVREQARASLFLDLRGARSPWRGGQTHMHFLGYRRKPSGKLDSRSPGFGVWSDWPDLNDLCGWANVALEWVGGAKLRGFHCH